MEQFKRAILKNNQRQMVINRRSIQSLKAGRHVMAGWRDETTAMIAMWHEANRGLAQANAILRGEPPRKTMLPDDAEIALAVEQGEGVVRATGSHKRKKSRRERRTS